MAVHMSSAVRSKARNKDGPDVELPAQRAAEHGAWADSYLEQLLTRDAYSAVGNRSQRKLEAYFQALAAMSAGMPEHKTLYDAANIDRTTATTHDRLLADLFVTEEVTAWSAPPPTRQSCASRPSVTVPALSAQHLVGRAQAAQVRAVNGREVGAVGVLAGEVDPADG